MTGPVLLDGVPVLTAPAGDGPCAGGLVFRVGIVDEPPRLRGITHLVEHLVLAPLADSSPHANGGTAAEATEFHLHGGAAEVTGFLAGLGARLAELIRTPVPQPLLEREKSVLRAEQASRPVGLAAAMARHRYGGRGPGRTALPEWGLDGIGPADVADWARHFFTAGNVVGWLVSDTVPTGLRLGLPAGPPRRPEPAADLLSGPSFYAAGQGLIGWSATVERSTAASVLGQVLRRDLFRSLRTESGLSYDVIADLDPRFGGAAELLVAADVLPDRQDAALGVVLRALTRMKVGRLEIADVEAVRDAQLAELDRPDAERGLLAARAVDLVLGHPADTAAQRAARRRELDPAAVLALGQRVFGTGLLRVPAGHRAEQAGFAAPGGRPGRVVDGVRYPSAGDRDPVLVVGPDGVGCCDGPEAVSVFYRDCEALLVHPDGGRRLIGADGRSVAVEPTLHPGLDPGVLARIDGSVPASGHVPVSRSADAVPRPRTTAPADGSGAVRRPGPLTGARVAAGWVAVAVLLVVGLVAVLEHNRASGLVLSLGIVGTLMMSGITLRWRQSAGRGRPAQARSRKSR